MTHPNDSAMWGGPTQFFYSLTPEVIDRSLIKQGLRPTGRTIALNSLENRVYDVEVRGLENQVAPFSNSNVVIKFYRPGRWPLATLKEEHRFLQELLEYEIPVVTPLLRDEETLFHDEESGLYYVIFPKVIGRLKDELNREEIEQSARLIARLHNIGMLGEFKSRPTLNPHNMFSSGLETVVNGLLMPDHLRSNYQILVQQLEQLATPYLQHLSTQRIHGDFHRGNLLWTSQHGAWITDLDDSMKGPREQDLWLLLPGRDPEQMADLQKFLEAYHTMARNPVTLTRPIIEALRAMRMTHFNTWITKRWDDPVFQKFFAHVKEAGYWEQQLLGLKEQMALLMDC